MEPEPELDLAFFRPPEGKTGEPESDLPCQFGCRGRRAKPDPESELDPSTPPEVKEEEPEPELPCRSGFEGTPQATCAGLWILLLLGVNQDRSESFERFCFLWWLALNVACWFSMVYLMVDTAPRWREKLFCRVCSPRDSSSWCQAVGLLVHAAYASAVLA